jgi:hypothetical protein
MARVEQLIENAEIERRYILDHEWQFELEQLSQFGVNQTPIFWNCVYYKRDSQPS